MDYNREHSTGAHLHALVTEHDHERPYCTYSVHSDFVWKKSFHLQEKYIFIVPAVICLH